MIKSYITIALRIFRRNGLYVAINLLSLAFAITCCIIAYTNFSYSRDFDAEYHRQTDNVYRVNSIRNTDGNQRAVGMVPPALSDVLEKQISGIEQVGRLYKSGVLVKNDDHVFHEQIHYADNNLFKLFEFPLKYGSIGSFSEYSVVIGETFAKKYFGDVIPIGKKLSLINTEGHEESFTVTGVLKTPPANSSFHFDIVTPFSHALRGPLRRRDWQESEFISTFVEMKASKGTIEKNLTKYASQYNLAHKSDTVERFYLQPFNEIAQTSERDFSNYVENREMVSNPRGVVVIVPVVMSILIVLITCFNFINISVSFSHRRLNEIGMRKVFGGVRKQLVLQFLTENFILCMTAAGIAAIAAALLLPIINAYTGFALRMNFRSDIGIWIFLLGLPVVLAVLSGTYPALLATRFNPLKLLQGRARIGSMGGFAKSLLGAQFVISCVAIVVGIILTKNAKFQQEVDYGYNINDVIVVPVDNLQEYTSFTDAIRKFPEVGQIAGSTHQIAEWNSAYQATVHDNGNTFKAFVAHVGGEAYMKAMGLRLTTGRPFHEGSGLDADRSVIVNETFAQQNQLKDPVGQQVKLDSAYYTIIGVIEDYKQLGLHALVPPCILRLAKPEDFKYVIVQSRNELTELNVQMEKEWNRTVINKPYRAFFQADVVSKEQDLNRGFKTIAIGLALVTIVLSASGLFALVSLNIISRQKEIAMRKVLGATVSHLILLMNKDLVRIVAISFVIGSSLGYLFVDKFIFQFILVYHTTVGVDPFLLTLLFMLISCALTVGFKVYVAATSNPVDVLKDK